MKSFACIMSVSYFLHISENVVAKEYVHVTLDSCEENMGEPSKDRKFRYVRVGVVLSLHCHSGFALRI